MPRPEVSPTRTNDNHNNNSILLLLLRVRSTSNNVKHNERVVFPGYRHSTMAISVIIIIDSA